MVVASFPLWVVHSTAASAADSGPPATATATATATASTTASTSALADHLGAGADPSSLLRLNAGTHRAPVYGCDVQPGGRRFATAGGDGTVKIWGMAGVFPFPGEEEGEEEKAGDGAGARARARAAHFDASGRYVSSEASSSEAAAEASSSGEGGSEGEDALGTGQGQGGDGGRGASAKVVPAAAQPVEAQPAASQPSNPAPSVTIERSKDGRKRKRAVLLSTTPFDQEAAEQEGGGEEQQQRQQNLGPASSSPPQLSGRSDPEDIGGDGRQRLLCTLSSHAGSVLAVRWSPSGRYLASAGDDTLVLVYARSSARQPSGNLQQGTPDAERWARVRICRGHALDVVGLAWKPDDTHLVSCSLDSQSPICVWRMNLGQTGTGTGSRGQPGGRGGPGAGSMLAPYKTLSATGSSGGGSGGNHNRGGAGEATLASPERSSLGGGGGLSEGHTSTVKGVAFDPTGKYLASSGDDPSVCIWRAFDDWGLEARIDREDGIFGASSKTTAEGTGGDNNKNKQQQEQQKLRGGTDEELANLSSMSLFRRISFSPDGTHLCVTNATARGKSVASTVSREGWRTACVGKGIPVPPGAANLVGHRAAVVASRHCPHFIDGRRRNLQNRPGGRGASSEEENDEEEVSEEEDAEPSYATLLALGDRRGFITVWSTRKARPIFKAQISESRCTVTDLSWGLHSSGGGGRDMILLVSLLDGHVAALRFGIPSEVGALLPESGRKKIFRLKYGIDLKDSAITSLTIGEGSSRPRLIENALQLTMEDEGLFGAVGDMDELPSSSDEDQDDSRAARTAALRRAIDSRAAAQSGVNESVRKVPDHESGTATKLSKLQERLSGDSDEGQLSKKRQNNEKGNLVSDTARAGGKDESIPRSQSGAVCDPERDVGSEEKKDDAPPLSTGSQSPPRHHLSQPGETQRHCTVLPAASSVGPVISVSSQRVYSVDLPIAVDQSAKLEDPHRAPMVADCSNTSLSIPGRGQTQVPVINLTISKSGHVYYRDTIVGATTTAVCASESTLAIGTYDGTVYLYGTSPSTGWKSGLAFRCHAPLIMGGSVVRISVRQYDTKVDMLVVTSDGAFGLYALSPISSLLYRGTVLPPMEHMRLSSNDGTHRQRHRGHERLPELARITVTDTDRLLVILAYPTSSSSAGTSSESGGSRGVTRGMPPPGGNLQAFVYNQAVKLWSRVSDSRFVMSDFYNDTNSSSSFRTGKSSLEKIEALTRAGTGKIAVGGVNAPTLCRYGGNGQNTDGRLGTAITRSHCEDRMACALGLGSSNEFELWLGCYIRRLAQDGAEAHLRLVVDLLLGRGGSSVDMREGSDTEASHEMARKNAGASLWWLSSSEAVLDMDRKGAIRKIVLPEMSKNRALQRLTNEIATDFESM